MIIFGSYFIFMVYVTSMTAYTISDKDKEIFFKEILYLHNQKRESHGVGRLSWNTDMVTDANNLLQIFIPTIPLPPSSKYGINTYVENFDNDFKLDAKKVFNSWYDTETYYNYDNQKLSTNTDPFTQIVWSSTQLLSMSLLVGKDQYKVMALYFPRGNNRNEFKADIQRPSSFNQMPFDPLNKSV